jgi:hypothetical protein
MEEMKMRKRVDGLHIHKGNRTIKPLLMALSGTEKGSGEEGRWRG